MGVDWGDYFGTEEPDEIVDIMSGYEPGKDCYDPFGLDELIDAEERDIYAAEQEIKNKRYEDGWFYLYNDGWPNYTWRVWKRYISPYSPERKVRAPKKSKKVLKAEKNKKIKLQKLKRKKEYNQPFSDLGGGFASQDISDEDIPF